MKYTLLPLICSFLVPCFSLASNITWSSTAVSVSTVGDTVVETGGSLVYAYNLGGGTVAVNGVTFDALSSYDDLDLSYSNTAIYGDGNVSANFESVLDSFSYALLTETPNYATFNLTGLTIGNTYQVQLFVSDDRNALLQSRTQTFGAGNTSAASENGQSYSLLGDFVADSTVQPILMTAYPGSGEPFGSPTLNGMQLRAIPEPSSLLIVVFAGLFLVRRRVRR